ncbi:VanZ family protein [Bifidobacterium platyrrhinorum]|uniref:Teicoplanin resistance protein VanZ n=1 Tax=Bifidobacterium platyrrhinorum TaxID=2661628 RepID=A0A6L9SSQ9_9BIFI|nr:VanZ family protein [Bifidobacterium platyrrhinorum]NEG55610.1 teicoplanin resistance protein VanZ [Bifidobacterium platyrrhinorum]
MLGYLSYFSTSFIIAVLLWPFVAAVLTLPILAGLYHRHHRLRALSVGASYLSVLYFTGLVAFTLYPMPDDPDAFCAAHAGDYAPQLDPLRFLEDLQYGGLYGLLQLVMNVVFFVPLGFVFARWLRWRWWAVVGGGFAMSLFIESSQLTGFWGLYPCAYRQFDVNDLMTNTLGAVVGLGVARLFGAWVPAAALPGRDEVNTRPGALHRTVAFVIDMMLVAAAYFPLTMAVVLAFHALATPLANGDFTLFGGLVTVGVGWMNAIAPTAAALAFLVFELLVPLTHRGQTLGGMFTHMTVETVTRHGGRRAAFYAVRTVVLGTLTVMAITGFVAAGSADDGVAATDGPLRIAVIGFIVLFLFAMVARRMPWDSIPGERAAHVVGESVSPISPASHC